MKKRRPPVQEKDLHGKPLEPPLANDKRQFINLRLQQAIRSGRSYDEPTVKQRAKIDWRRMQQAERRRRDKTERLDEVREPIVPSHADTIMANDTVQHLLQNLIDHERAVITLQILLGFTRTEAATILGITNRAVQLTRQRAINRLRTLLSEECFPT